MSFDLECRAKQDFNKTFIIDQKVSMFPTAAALCFGKLLLLIPNPLFSCRGVFTAVTKYIEDRGGLKLFTLGISFKIYLIYFFPVSPVDFFFQDVLQAN